MRTRSGRSFDRFGLAAAAVLLGLLVANPAQATTRTVNSVADSGGSCPATCTLRSAVSASGAGDTINFDPTVFGAPQTITLTAGEILISHSGGTLTVTGPGANLLTISGNNASRIFRVAGATTFVLSSVTISDGKAADVGGGVVSDGTLTFSDCVVSGNDALAGTGLSTASILTRFERRVVMESPFGSER